MTVSKRITAFVLCTLIVLSCVAIFPASNTASAASSSVEAKLIALKKKFPDGKYWNHIGSDKNNPDGYTSTPCTHHYSSSKCSWEYEGACGCNCFNKAIQCMGYAYKTAYELTGSVASESRGWTKQTSLDVSKLVVGDMIRYLKNTHSITVVGVKGNTIAYTGANWGGNCLIKWSTMDVSQITGFTYVYHKNDNDMKNSDFSFITGETNEIWKTKESNDASLNIRSSASASSSSNIIGSIPPGEKFRVISKSYSTTTKYLWAKVEYDGTVGYSVLNYAVYVSGSTEQLELINLTDLYTGVDCTLNWKAIDGADTYKIYIYDATGILIKTYTSYSTSRSITIGKSDEYFIKVVAKNSQVPSWKVSSDKIPVEVFSSELLKLTDISLPDSINMAVGSTEYCDYQITPSGARNDMRWFSSDTSVATVNSEGKISAKKCGVVTISCHSKSNSKVVSKCIVTVRPKKVTGLAQSKDAATTSKIKLSWKALSGVSGYRIYLVQDNGTYKKLEDVTKNSYTFTSLAPGTKKKVAVRAFKTVGDDTYFGAYSDPYASFTKPAKVENLSCVSQTESGFKLKWSRAKNANLYYIYKYNADKKTWVKIGYSRTNSYELSGSSDGSAQKYAVAAVIKHNGIRLLGARSSSIYGFRAPSVPKVTASAGSSSVTLKWGKCTGAAGFEVYQKKDGSYKLLATLKSSTLSYTVKSLSSSTTYIFKVKSVSTHGSQTKKSTSSAVKITTS